MDKEGTLIIFDEELIDTQWDVNKNKENQAHALHGINRYIVGCKFKQKSRSGDSVWELIDTQWDVNYLAQGGYVKPNTELIDTQWDVN